jgi:cell division protein FtsB
VKVPRRATARPAGRDRARPVAGRGAARPAVRGSRPRIPAQPGPAPVKPPGSGPRSYFTRRAAVFAAVLFIVAMTVAIPAQRYVAQRENIADLRAQVAQGTEKVAELEKQVATANEPYAIEREARRRLHFVMPGEQAYRVTDPLHVEEEKAEQAKAEGAWWDRMVGSVDEAAQPVEELPLAPAAPETR